MRPWPRLLMAVVLLVPAFAAAQPFGYVVDSDGVTTAHDLYRIDLSTGALTLLGPVRPAVGPTYVDVEGLALSPSGELYAVDDALDVLLRLDTSNGRATLVGPLGTSGLGPAGNLDYGLAFTCDGRLWLSSDTLPRLWEVNLATGEAIAPRDLPVGLTGLAGRGSLLYGMGIDGNLYRYSPSSGVATQVGPLGIPAFDDGGLDFDADGNLWAIAEYIPSNPALPSRIYRVDAQTGAATFVANSKTGIEGLAIAPPACLDRFNNAQTVPGPGPFALLLLVLTCAGLALVRLRDAT